VGVGGGREGGGRGGRAAHSAEKESASWLFLFVFVLHFFLLSEFFSLLILCQIFISFLPLRVPFPPSHVPPPPAHPGHQTALPPRRTHICTVPNRLYSEIVHLFSSNGGGRGSPASPPPPPTAPRPDILCILFCRIGGV
jgi:hypothetical protein